MKKNSIYIFLSFFLITHSGLTITQARSIRNRYKSLSQLPQKSVNFKGLTWEKESYVEQSYLNNSNNQVISLPKGFLFGGADSDQQTRGSRLANGQDSKNSWTEYEKIHKAPNMQSLSGNDRTVRFKEDAQLLADLNFNIFRLSISWDKVEPEHNVFNTQELDWYVSFIDELTSRGIRPMLCFFHHAWPLWFGEKGAFEKKQNIQDFVDFASLSYEYLLKYVKHPRMLDYVLTFNEPIGYSFAGYYQGNLPPNIKDKTFRSCGTVIRNMLDAHAATYDKIKQLNPHAQISMAFVFNPLDPYDPTRLLDRIGAYFGNYLLHDVRERYIKTGYFSWISYGLFNDYNAGIIDKLDFVGVNYYTHRVIKGFSGSHNQRPGEEYPDNNKSKPIYAEGLYRAIVKAAQFNKPIIVTENGIATENDALKNEYLRKHLIAVQEAIKNGYDVRGYMWWSPIDCFSWDNGYTKYGFVGVDLKTKNRFVRTNATKCLQK